MLPKRREKDLHTEKVDNETIVYDQKRHKVHCLNPIATLVWQHCDGRTSEAKLAKILHRELGQPAEEALVRLTLEKLGQAHLLEGGRTDANSTSRREAVKQLARFGAVAATALVVTIAAPTAAQAASCAGAGQACPGTVRCCTGNGSCTGGICCFGLSTACTATIQCCSGAAGTICSSNNGNPPLSCCINTGFTPPGNNPALCCKNGGLDQNNHCK